MLTAGGGGRAANGERRALMIEHARVEAIGIVGIIGAIRPASVWSVSAIRIVIMPIAVGTGPTPDPWRQRQTLVQFAAKLLITPTDGVPREVDGVLDGGCP